MITLKVTEHNHAVADDEPFTVLTVGVENGVSRSIIIGEPYDLWTVIDGLRILASTLEDANHDLLDTPAETGHTADYTVLPGEDHDTGC